MVSAHSISAEPSTALCKDSWSQLLCVGQPAGSWDKNAKAHMQTQPLGVVESEIGLQIQTLLFRSAETMDKSLGGVASALTWK